MKVMFPIFMLLSLLAFGAALYFGGTVLMNFL